MFTSAKQDYVKSIFKLQNQNDGVSTSYLASKLGVTASSVSGMLKELSSEKRLLNVSMKVASSIWVKKEKR